MYVGMAQVKSDIIPIKTPKSSARRPNQAFTNQKSLMDQYPGIHLLNTPPVSNIATSHLFIGALSQTEKYVEQVEKHFSEMKGDVGMSPHKKEGNKTITTPKQKLIHNPIPTSLFPSDMYLLFMVVFKG